MFYFLIFVSRKELKQSKLISYNKLIMEREAEIVGLVRDRFRSDEPLDCYNFDCLTRKYPNLLPAHISSFFLEVINHQQEYNPEGKGFKLRLKGNELGNMQISNICNHRWVYLRELYLHRNKIGPEGCSSLTQAMLGDLQLIDLRNNKIGDLACKYLSKANWTNLKEITLQYNQITEKGCRHLSKAIWMELEVINLRKYHRRQGLPTHLRGRLAENKICCHRVVWSEGGGLQIDDQEIKSHEATHLENLFQQAVQIGVVSILIIALTMI